MSKILIIEDEPAIKKAIMEALGQEGFEVEGAVERAQPMPHRPNH